ncbi:MAG: hypothetical protein EPN91_05460 [Salinibacterium sp.]|nr:MAG: hypothetical protein EPN91_05460 [Salinibacterium sp.]
MDVASLLTNIDRLLKAKRLSDNGASNLAGRPDAIRNLRRYAKGQIKGCWTIDVLDDVARALDTSSWELLRPPGAFPGDETLEETVAAIVDRRLAEHVAPRQKKIR